MKVYSFWVKTINTQKFQIEYFLDLTDKNNVDLDYAKDLYLSTAIE